MVKPHQGDGLYIVVEGIDASGKSTAINGLLDAIGEPRGFKVFDLDEWYLKDRFFIDQNPENDMYWSQHPILINEIINGVTIPRTPGLLEASIVKLSEPSYGGSGADTRFELIQNNGRDYSARSKAQGYSLCREILAKRTLLPLLHLGTTVLCSRNITSSLLYQPQDAEERKEPELTPRMLVDELLFPGNHFVYNNCMPDLMIIQSGVTGAEAMQRLDGRDDKNDGCEFENEAFQEELKTGYEQDWLREMMEARGTKVEYVDATQSPRKVAEDCSELFRKFMSKIN